MARAISIQVVKQPEESIISYEHHIDSKFIRIYVGTGETLEDGTFRPIPSQIYESTTIEGENYDILLAATNNKPQGVFRPDDLWQFIDVYRAKELARVENAKLIAIENSKKS